ncbi:capsid protein [Helleborus net necrosis virus]|uniref:Capsid protein n=1 Tax=Helleborus net necrosis virus TaxID=592206 RepID=B9UZ27_9VIRU|nr:capsid protein [Helleborus net necrosis virus]ACM45983.1 capsid protein [Helleborus net necrosis virus]
MPTEQEIEQQRRTAEAQQIERNRRSNTETQQQQRQATPPRRQQALDLEDEEQAVGLEKTLLDRFLKLKEFNLNNLTATRLVNSGFETGRPKARVAASMRGDMANIFTSPTLDTLQALPWNPVSSRLATAEELAKISAKIEALGFPRDQLAKLFWDVSRYCASNSSSPYSDPKGVIEFDGGAITRDAALAVIRDISSLRRVCRSYSKIVWNYMLVNAQPPEDWQAKGFTENTKYAAFDFFDSIMNSAAIQPAEGLIRKPTPEEIIANETHKRLALDRASSNRRFANYSAEVTGGKFGRELKRSYRGSESD